MEIEKRPRAKITWKIKGKEKIQLLDEGRYHIGNTIYSNIMLNDKAEEEGLIAMLYVYPDNVVLKCIGEQLPIRIDNKNLALEEEIVIGISSHFFIGKTSIKVDRIFEETESNFGKRDISQGSEHILDLRKIIANNLFNALKSAGINLDDITSFKALEQIRGKLKEVVSQVELPPNINSKEIEEDVFDEIIGLGPLEKLLSDKSISEVMVNRYNQIYIEKDGKLQLSGVSFSSEQSLLSVIERIVSTVGRRIDASSPIVDARLLDGSRVNAVISPVALKGACLTIRRFPEKPISVDQLVKWGSFSQFTGDLFKLLVESHLNIMVSGGTGSGKTTLLNALSSFIPENERIITVEDSAELQLQQPHVISLETRPPNLEGKGDISIRDLVKNCLRMRPDRIVVGECRGGEALDMLQAMNTGHDGSLTTAHANSPEDMLRRLETMVLTSGVDFPLVAIREQIASAVHVIIQQCRLKTGRRLVTHVTWIVGLDRQRGDYITYDLVKFKRKEGTDQGELHINREALVKFSNHYELQKSVNELLQKYEVEIK